MDWYEYIMNDSYTTKTLVKVILLTRDETDMIEDFISYWGSIFEPKNVIVIDNGSTSQKVLDAYASHRSNGGTVVVDARPFSNAVDFMTEHMRGVADSGTCEWIFPIETDEFIFVQPFVGHDRVRIQDMRDAVFSHLRNDVPGDVGVLKYGYFWGSSVDPDDSTYVRGAYPRPTVDIVRFYDQGWDKVMVRASAFDKMVQWCHLASSKPGYLMGVSRVLGLLHFHDSGKRRAVERAIPVVDGYKLIDVHSSRTTSEKLRDTGRIRHMHLMCGHKLGYLDIHLRRLSTLQAFRRHLGRLPYDASEMLEISDHPDVMANKRSIESIIRNLLSLPPSGVAQKLHQNSTRDETGAYNYSESKTWDELLYHEPKMDHTFVVDQVRQICL
jgi:hypothetical protein